MIKSIRLQNFFGFQDCTVNLEPGANVLIGINGSGKSNFFKAFKIAEDGSIKRLNNRINKSWRGVNDILFKGGISDFCELTFSIIPSVFKTSKRNAPIIEYSIKIERFQKTDYILSEVAYVKRENESDQLIFSYSNGAGIIAEEEKGKHVERGFSTTSGGKELVSTLYFADHKSPFFATLREAMEDILCYSQFDVLEDSQIRKSSPPIADAQLDEYGDNLVSVLNYLKINHRESFKRIEEALQNVNDKFQEIEFIHTSNQLELHLLENPNFVVSPQHISDGTLRFLCLMAILYNPNRGGVICIDEPELGLHPDMILTLYEAIKYASKTSQIIISTHSAQLLDCFDLSEVIVFDKNANNATVVRQGMKEDDFSAWKDDYNVGKMWRSGAIGGNR